MKEYLILHGPNLNLLGKREPEVYGDWTLDNINEELNNRGRRLGVRVRVFQSNSVIQPRSGKLSLGRFNQAVKHINIEVG